MRDVWAPTVAELSGLSAQHRVAFVAAVVQRAAPGFTDLIRRRRSDHEFFAETIDFLWAVAAGAEPTALPARRSRLNRFKEMRATREPDNWLFFADQAVHLLDYALDTVEGDPDGVTNIIKGAMHMTDGFDQDLDEDDNRHRELRFEEAVLQVLLRSPELTPDIVSALRQQAQRDAEAVSAAVARLTPGIRYWIRHMLRAPTS